MLNHDSSFILQQPEGGSFTAHLHFGFLDLIMDFIFITVLSPTHKKTLTVSELKPIISNIRNKLSL